MEFRIEVKSWIKKCIHSNKLKKTLFYGQKFKSDWFNYMPEKYKIHNGKYAKYEFKIYKFILK